MGAQPAVPARRTPADPRSRGDFRRRPDRARRPQRGAAEHGGLVVVDPVRARRDDRAAHGRMAEGAAPMNRRQTVAGMAAAAAMLVAACGSSEPNDPGTKDFGEVPAATVSPEPDVPEDDTRTRVERGQTKEAAISTAEAFLTGWAEFVPWSFEPDKEWFDRWDKYATREFIGRMQLSLNRMWSWTWNERKKVFDVHVLNVDAAWLNSD